ncbi:hypothetical protein JIP4600_80088 [Tenacibaculum maritimum]|nr:hypothetical protein JIP4600_80088 [Tenacibaculum maritimum]
MFWGSNITPKMKMILLGLRIHCNNSVKHLGGIEFRHFKTYIVYEMLSKFYWFEDQ